MMSFSSKALSTLLPAKEAGLEATDAIAYASSNHSKWFWDGVGGPG